MLCHYKFPLFYHANLALGISVTMVEIHEVLSVMYQMLTWLRQKIELEAGSTVFKAVLIDLKGFYSKGL